VRDAEGDNGRDDRDASKGGGRMRKGHANKESRGLGGVNGLARSQAKRVQSNGEGVESWRAEVMHEYLGIIRMVGGSVADTVDGDPQAWLSTKPGGKGLGDEEVQEGRERAALANTRNPKSRAGGNAIGGGGGDGMVKENAGPIEHARGGPHDGHDVKEEGAVHSVKGFGDIDEDDSAAKAVDSHHLRKESGECDGVTDVSAREKGRLFWTDGASHSSSKATRQNLG
jgi:hypothetical protein